MNHPKRSAPPKSSSSSTGFGSSFLTSFFGYYFLAGLLSAALAGALPADPDPDPDPTFAVPALINLIYGINYVFEFFAFQWVNDFIDFGFIELLSGGF